MRKLLKQARVVILDHSPALELLVAGGVVSGALGHRLQTDRAYRIDAGAVVVASGGVAYLSKTLGCDVNTGDGLLMAAEAGAELSGMEFSAQYGICPAYSSVTKGLPYFWATFTDESGRAIEPHPVRHIAVALLGSFSREMGWRAAKPYGSDQDPTFRFRRLARDRG